MAGGGTRAARPEAWLQRRTVKRDPVSTGRRLRWVSRGSQQSWDPEGR